MSLMGLDIGTSGCKAISFTADGNPLSRSYREYSALYPAENFAELNGSAVWEAIRSVIREAALEVEPHDPVEALGISAIGDSVTPIARDGTPLARCVCGSLDRRAYSQSQRLKENLDPGEVFARTGTGIQPMCALPKIMWFKEQKPEIYRAAWKMAGWQEIIHAKLGLHPSTDLSQACRTLTVNLNTGDYDSNLIEAAGIDPSKLPDIKPSFEPVGVLDREHASMVGLRPGVVVVTGGFDQACAALGAGAIEPDYASLSMGTVELIAAVSDRPRFEDALLQGGHGCGFHVVPDRFISLAYIITAGAILRWYRDTLGFDALEKAQSQGADPYDLIVKQTPDRPAKVYVLPYFAGSGTPGLDPRQQGAIFGLQLHTPRSEIVKGILDGISYELRFNLESLHKAGFSPARLLATGGGVRSPQWMQSTADIVRRPIESTPISEAGCFGAAILAGTGGKVYHHPADALKRLKPEETYHPRKEYSEEYNSRFEVYKEIRRRMTGLVL